MKTILMLEELIRSYNITALDNFKAMEALKVLKEIDLKYDGFGEDKEISSKQLLNDYLASEVGRKEASDNKLYFNFVPSNYSIIEQNGNCLIELHNRENTFYVTDKQISLFYEMISDIYEYGEINEGFCWEHKDSAINLKIHNTSNQNDCIISLMCDENICDLLNLKNNFETKICIKTEIVLNINSLSLAKILNKILFNFKVQNAGVIGIPKNKIVRYSEVLEKTLSCDRYCKILSKVTTC